MSLSSLVHRLSLPEAGGRLAAIFAVAACVCMPLSASGQEPGTARLEGVVFDSTSMQLLPGPGLTGFPFSTTDCRRSA
jgi:hypothetical protein